MSLLDYIKGNRKGKIAHNLEKEAMTDPFLSEALEGFDMVEDDHLARIFEIQKKIKSKKTDNKKQQSIWTSIAAVAVVALIGVVISHLVTTNSTNNGLHAQTSILAPINIYIPEAIYTENIAIIATRNTMLTKNVSVELKRDYKTDLQSNIEYEVLQEDISSLRANAKSDNVITIAAPSPEENIKPIHVYLPTSINAGLRRHNQNPEPIIGFKEYYKYLKREIRKPDTWPCEGKKGKVLIEFSVDDDGDPYDIEVEYGLCGTSDDEAVRLIKEGPKWTPSNKRGQIKIEF